MSTYKVISKALVVSLLCLTQICLFIYTYSDTGGAGAAGPGRKGAPGRGI